MNAPVDSRPASPRFVRRDLAPALLAAALAFAALPVTGWAAMAWLPATPGGFGALAWGLAGLAFLAVGARGPAWRPVVLALAAAPALILAERAGGGLPGPGWWVLAAVAVVLALLRVGRVPAVAVVMGLLAALAVFEGADAARLVGAQPGGAAATFEEPPTRALRSGVRRGAPVPLPAGAVAPLGAGPGPWWLEAERATHPGPRPVVLLVGVAAPPAGARALARGTLVPGDAAGPLDRYGLRAYDAVVVREDAWGPDDPRAADKADAVARYVHGGGLLVGPGPASPWPPRLGRALGQAGRATRGGPDGVRRLGLGRVVRAANQADVAAIFAADLWVRDVRTPLLDVTGSRPAPLEGWTPWADAPASRGTQGLLLWLHAAALAVLALVLRAPASLLGGSLLAAGVTAAALVWTAPQDPGFRVAGAFVELGGAAGRRIEGVWISAGPAGYRGHVRFEGEGVLALRGARLDADGRVAVAPGRSAWIVRETRGRGPRPDEREDRRQAGALGLVRGRIDPGRLQVVHRPALPVRVEDWGPVPAAGLRVRGAGR